MVVVWLFRNQTRDQHGGICRIFCSVVTICDWLYLWRNKTTIKWLWTIQMQMLQRITILFFVFVISSCCSTRQCEIDKAELKIYNLTQKFPELQKQIDTIVISDTIRFETISVDTSFIITNNSDTIIVENDKIKIRYIKKDSVIYLTGECEGDTIYLTIEIPVEKIVIRKPTFAEHAKDWTFFVFAICAFLLVLRIFFKDVFKVFNIFK